MTRLPAVLASAIGALTNPNKLQKTFKMCKYLKDHCNNYYEIY